MSLFIPQLLIISALGLMVQTAPISLTKRSTETNSSVLQTRLYCAARDLHNARGSFPDADPKNDDSTASTLFNLFSNHCKEFTTVMTLKHKLLVDIFDVDTTLGLDFKNLSTILTNLETMANIFNDLELNENNTRCVELTPAQYNIMYTARYTTKILESIGDLKKWYPGTSLYPEDLAKNCN